MAVQYIKKSPTSSTKAVRSPQLETVSADWLDKLNQLSTDTASAYTNKAGTFDAIIRSLSNVARSTAGTQGAATAQSALTSGFSPFEATQESGNVVNQILRQFYDQQAGLKTQQADVGIEAQGAMRGLNQDYLSLLTNVLSPYYKGVAGTETYDRLAQDMFSYQKQQDQANQQKLLSQQASPRSKMPITPSQTSGVPEWMTALMNAGAQKFAGTMNQPYSGGVDPSYMSGAMASLHPQGYTSGVSALADLASKMKAGGGTSRTAGAGGGAAGGGADMLNQLLKVLGMNQEKELALLGEAGDTKRVEMEQAGETSRTQTKESGLADRLLSQTDSSRALEVLKSTQAKEIETLKFQQDQEISRYERVGKLSKQPPEVIGQIYDPSGNRGLVVMDESGQKTIDLTVMTKILKDMDEGTGEQPYDISSFVNQLIGGKIDPSVASDKTRYRPPVKAPLTYEEAAKKASLSTLPSKVTW